MSFIRVKSVGSETVVPLIHGFTSKALGTDEFGEYQQGWAKLATLVRIREKWHVVELSLFESCAIPDSTGGVYPFAKYDTQAVSEDAAVASLGGWEGAITRPLTQDEWDDIVAQKYSGSDLPEEWLDRKITPEARGACSKQAQ